MELYTEEVKLQTIKLKTENTNTHLTISVR